MIRRARVLSFAALALLAEAETAQSSPYYVGISQALSHESNLLRLLEGQPTPDGSSKSDTVSSTGLVAGIDQRFGRQRLSGSGSLRANRYNSNSDYNSGGYSANLGLDWETINNLSGNVSIGADRKQRPDLRDVNNQVVTVSNDETAKRFSLTAALGMAGPLAIEAGLSGSDLRYSAAVAEYAEYKESGGSLGLRYRLGGATSVALAFRQSSVNYPNLLVGQIDRNDRRKRSDVDFNVVYTPTGSSRFDLRISQGKTRYDQFTERDFSGTTGALAWTFNPGGRLRFNTRLARDTGQNSGVATTASSQITDILRVSADYDVTGKIVATGSAEGYRRTLDSSGRFSSGIRGTDSGGTYSLGARWEALRSLTVGCQASYEKRGRNNQPVLSDAYSASVYSCYGQFVLQ